MPKSGKKPWYAHGNWYGPGWSDGKAKDSVNYRKRKRAAPPVDAVDRAAREHDAVYADVYSKANKRKRKFNDPDLTRADIKFAKKAFRSGGVYGIAGGIAVGLQGAARAAMGGLLRKPYSVDDQRGKQKENISMAKYFQRFPRPVRKARPRLKKSIRTREEFAQELGPDKHVACVGICSIPGIRYPVDPPDVFGVPVTHPVWGISYAIIRYICRKEFGVNIVAIDQNLTGIIPYAYVNGVADTKNPVRINIYKKDDPETITVGNANATQMLWNSGESWTSTKRVYDWVQELAVAITRDIIAVQSSPLRWKLFGYNVVNVHLADAGPAAHSERRPSAIRSFDDLYCTVKMKTVVRFQNSTGGSNGVAQADYDTQSITANPLTGQIYHFRDVVPYLRSVVRNSVPIISGADIHGMNTRTYNQDVGGVAPYALAPRNYFYGDANKDGFIRVTTGANGEILDSIPPKEVFTNLTGYTPFKMNPGDIKSHVIRFNFNGRVNKLLEGLQQNHLLGEGERVAETMKGFGTCDMFFFREFVRSNADNIYLQMNASRYCEVDIYNRARNYCEPVLPYSLYDLNNGPDKAIPVDNNDITRNN